MPILHVKVSSPVTPELVRHITDLLMERTSRILHKSPALTAITIDGVPPTQWLVAGETLASLGKNSVYFDIKITDGTNTKGEKAQYIAECFEAFERLLAPLHEESYIFVHDVRAEAYGYGGKTQEWRYIMS